VAAAAAVVVVMAVAFTGEGRFRTKGAHSFGLQVAIMPA